MSNLMPSSSVGGKDYTGICVVDDDFAVRGAVVRLLRSKNFEAKAFASASEFLKSRCQRTARCLILDIKMDGLSGLDLQNQLNADDNRIPIIFISAHADADTRARAMSAGAIDVLSKPFSEEALLACVRHALTQSE